MSKLSDLKNKLSDLNTIKSSARFALSHLENAKKEMKKASSELSAGVIIGGEPYDKGSLNDMISILDDIAGDISILYNRSSNKITETQNEITKIQNTKSSN